MGVRSLIKRALRISWRITVAIFLISLPVTFFPIISGASAALTFHFWNLKQVIQNVHSFEFEAESRDRLDYFNVRGAMSIHEFMEQKGPFHVPRLTSLDWFQKLGVIPPNEHMDDSAGVDKLASFDGLVRDVSCATDAVKPTRYWVYVTTMSRWTQSEWDIAFDEILQELYVKPLQSSDTGLAYIDCASTSFLCGVWGIKAPSLLHVTIEEEPVLDKKARQALEAEDENAEQPSWLDALLEPNYTYNVWEGNLHPATVRVIELPLDDNEPLLPRNTLPTPALQLRALLLDSDSDSLVEHWEPHRGDVQLIRRFNDLDNDLSERRGTWHYYLNQCDNWYTRAVLRPIFGKEFTGHSGFMADVQNIVFTVGILLASAVHYPCAMVWQVYAWYFGLGWDGAPIQNMSIDEEQLAGAGGNWMDDMFAGFLDKVKTNLSAEASERAGRAAVTSQ